jgi:hypothetical protein
MSNESDHTSPPPAERPNSQPPEEAHRSRPIDRAEKSGGYTGGGPLSSMRPPMDVQTGAFVPEPPADTGQADAATSGDSE